MTDRIFVGDARVANLPADNRGLAYGDGVFETMRAHRGAVQWRNAHWARLVQGADRLRLPLPDRLRVDTELDALLRAQPDGVVKLVLARGAGPRGYAPAPDAAPLWLLSLQPFTLQAPPRPGGLVVRWCDTRLSLQPLLAGIKHCNRLEQVLARGEWQDAAIDEGLMLDSDGNVVCATAANLFVFHAGHWSTPAVDRCGVAGVCRGWALQALDVRVSRLSPAQVEAADAVFLCNAVRGILPVARLGARSWGRHPALDDALRRLADAHPAFSDRLETP